MLHTLFQFKERNSMRHTLLLAASVVIVTIFIPADVTAQCGGFGNGWNSGWTAGSLQLGTATGADALKKYNNETKNLQVQFIDKQAQLQKELLKDEPNLDTIGGIQKDIIDIQINMQKIARKLGVTTCLGTCPLFQRNCRGGGCGGGPGQCAR